MADISASVWDETDANNTTAAPDGAPEGMAPSGVNNVLRAHQGAVKRWYNWTIPKLTGGSSTAYTLSYTVTPGALVDGMTHLVEFDQANGAAATLNVNALGALPLHYYSVGVWRAVPAALWGANAVFRVAYHNSSGAYRILNLPDRTGEVVPFAGSTAPAGSLLCYGQAISRTTYAGLFAAISTTYGTGDGSTTFNLPDLRGRVAAGKGDMGGSESGRLNGQIGSTLGAAGGAQTVTLTIGHIPAHSHGMLTRSDLLNTGVVSAFASAASNLGQTTQEAGGGQAHANVQPTIVLNYVIKI